MEPLKLTIRLIDASVGGTPMSPQKTPVVKTIKTPKRLIIKSLRAKVSPSRSEKEKLEHYMSGDNDSAFTFHLV